MVDDAEIWWSDGEELRSRQRAAFIRRAPTRLGLIIYRRIIHPKLLVFLVPNHS
jgi:hypothetical protein